MSDMNSLLQLVTKFTLAMLVGRSTGKALNWIIKMSAVLPNIVFRTYPYMSAHMSQNSSLLSTKLGKLGSPKNPFST